MLDRGAWWAIVHRVVESDMTEVTTSVIKHMLDCMYFLDKKKEIIYKLALLYPIR